MKLPVTQGYFLAARLQPLSRLSLFGFRAPSASERSGASDFCDSIGRLATPVGEGKNSFDLRRVRQSPFTTAGFARMVERAGEVAGLKFKAHPHMLRHACGFALASKRHDTRALQAYLGHKNIQHAVRYTELSPTRFKSFWRV